MQRSEFEGVLRNLAKHLPAVYGWLKKQPKATATEWFDTLTDMNIGPTVATLAIRDMAKAGFDEDAGSHHVFPSRLLIVHDAIVAERSKPIEKPKPWGGDPTGSCGAALRACTAAGLTGTLEGDREEERRRLIADSMAGKGAA